MKAKDQLFSVADQQQGFFTAQQAEAAGIPSSNFNRNIRSGEWIKEERGIYRLARYPVSDRPELVRWSLWSRNRQDVPQGIWSHDTALDIHDLSDIMPNKMHMTVPRGFRRSCAIDPVLYLHFGDLNEADTEMRQGYRVTTPLRTLIDVIIDGRLFDDLIKQAVREGLRRGLLSRQELLDASKLYPFTKLIRFIDES